MARTGIAIALVPKRLYRSRYVQPASWKRCEVSASFLDQKVPKGETLANSRSKPVENGLPRFLLKSSKGLSIIATTLLRLVRNPRWILLLDAIGAAMTALTAFLLLVTQRLNTGLPTGLLVAMGVAAVGFALFDAAALWLHADPFRSLQAIAMANASYCVFAVAALWVHRSTVTGLGILYFCLEIPVIAFIAAWEWRIARRR